MSTLVAQTISNGTVSTSSANVIQGSAKAWVNFNGTGTVAIRASYNVSSITDNGTGQYTVNFTNAMSDVNYGSATSLGGTPLDCVITTANFAVGSIQLLSYRIPTGVAIDASQVSVSIFR